MAENYSESGREDCEHFEECIARKCYNEKCPGDKRTCLFWEEYQVVDHSTFDNQEEVEKRENKLEEITV